MGQSHYGMMKNQPNWWTSIYAAHFLIEANKAGFDVDKGLLETLLGYINQQFERQEDNQLLL